MAEGSSPDSDNLVISGVIEDVRQSFLDSGMDLETLAKLEKLWISKLSSMDEKVVADDKDAKQEDDAVKELETVSVHKKSVKKSKKVKNMKQVDGPADSSEEGEDDESDDDNDDGDDAEDDSDSDLDPDGEEYDGGIEMEPPCSGDDNSDEEACDLFDTENVVVCQYDKISRARNKWKFLLKDGVMNLNGRDYVFQKAHGEADW